MHDRESVFSPDGARRRQGTPRGDAGQLRRHGHRVVRLLPLRDGRGARVRPAVFPERRSAASARCPRSATFAVGFVARPLGGIIFGHFGDRVGRKSMLIYSLMIMGVATFLIGLLPTYATIGVLGADPAGPVACAQGIGVGGEWGGAVLMAVEHSPPGRRGLLGKLAADGRARRIVPVDGRVWCGQHQPRRRAVPRVGLACAVSAEHRAHRRRACSSV